MIYRVKNLRIDLEARLLQRDGQALDVPRRVFDCLAYLIEHRARAVGRDELIEQVWHRSNVSDNQLAQTVLAARRLLDDDGVQQRLIRTVPGFGYHFIGSVEDADDVQPTAEPASAAAPSAPPPETATIALKPPRRWLPLALAAGVLLAAAGAAWWKQGSPQTELTAPAGAATTDWTWVLPAEVAVEDGAWARIGMATLIAERLRHNGVIVVPIENVLARLRERSGKLDPGALRREFAAARLIEPSITRNNELWRVELTTYASSGRTQVAATHKDLLQAGQRAADALTAANPAAPGDDSLGGRAGMIEQLIRSRDFESAASQLALLPDGERTHPEARLLEIRLAMEQGRMAIASERAAALRAQLSAQEFPAAAARLGLLEITLMRHRNASGWEQLVDTTVAQLEQHGSPRDLGAALIQRGNRAAIRGDYDAAQADFARAQQLFLNVADELGAARAGASLALLANARGRPAEALRLLEDCEQIYARYAAIGNQFTALRSMLSIQFGMLRWEDAQATSERARALMPLLTDSDERVSYLRARALLMLGSGRLREAAALLDECDRMRASGDSSSEANRSDDLYRLQLGLADRRFAAIEEDAARSYAKLEQHFDPKSIPRREQRDLALYLWLEARRQLRLEDSSRQLADLDPEPAALADPATMHAWLARGHRDLELGAVGDAETAYRNALKLAIEANKLSRVVTASDALIALLLASARVEEAAEVATGILARDPQLADRDFDTAVLLLRVRQAQGDDAGWRRAARAAQQ
ncbi:MAG TPA: winged helix-turn-helix domain-containing protein, partial [Xanthomonadales bacterium]|nr:winged helix-turn-helix domain-containing protein [Xanthomonadales bacterium]